MSFKNKLFTQVESVASRIKPHVDKAWQDVKGKLDALNGALASQSVPDARKAKVSDLSLRTKGEQAGQKGNNESVSGSSR